MNGYLILLIAFLSVIYAYRYETGNTETDFHNDEAVFAFQKLSTIDLKEKNELKTDLSQPRVVKFEEVETYPKITKVDSPTMSVIDVKRKKRASKEIIIKIDQQKVTETDSPLASSPLSESVDLTQLEEVRIVEFSTEADSSKTDDKISENLAPPNKKPRLVRILEENKPTSASKENVRKVKFASPPLSSRVPDKKTFPGSTPMSPTRLVKYSIEIDSSKPENDVLEEKKPRLERIANRRKQYSPSFSPSARLGETKTKPFIVSFANHDEPQVAAPKFESPKPIFVHA